MTTDRLRLGELTTVELAERLSRGPVVALLPVGSTEPHGPHLPLATDTAISDAVTARAVVRLRDQGIDALVCPAVPYGVTDFAEGFAGAVSVPAEALVPFLHAVGAALLGQGFAVVCLVNNHLEPAQDAAIREAARRLGPRAVVACPLTRKWARTLTDEFKSGACHAGRYETSLVRAIDEGLVREGARTLPALSLSLSEGIRSGLATFKDIGMVDAYTGDPAAASAAEGWDLIERLATMVVSEVAEALPSGVASAPP